MSREVAILHARERSKPLPTVKAGCFVRSTANDLGIGKILSGTADSVVVEYFDTIGPEGRSSEEVPRATVVRARIPCQTRCWFEKDGVWQVGRVIELLDSRYAIFMPSEKLELLTEPEFYVRWAKPIRDPMDVLVANGFETPLFHQLRRPFIDEMLRQRASCQGMTAVTSSVVHLFEHQVDVVSRVLVDDRQRYLLADEVGLGKTIEAGMIMRQCLLDRRGARIVVSVPKFLVKQWEAELKIKFGVRDFGSAAVRVIPHEDIAGLLGEPPVDMLVIDEAHQLMPTSGASPGRDDVYPSLRSLAYQVPALLLLSATPLLHNEAAFLAMLHLLDPDVYRLEDPDGFRERVAERQALALRVNALNPATPDFLLRRHAEFFSSAFPGDPSLKSLADRVLKDIDQPSGDRSELVKALRDHVQDTYRLHRRVLRNRRGGERTRGFQVRGRAGLTRLTADESVRTSVNDWLDEWRLQIASDHGVNRDSGEVALTMLECSGSDVTVLSAALRARLGDRDKYGSSYLSTEQEDTLGRLAVSALERAIIDSGLELLRGSDIEEARVRQVADVLGDMPGTAKAVAISGFDGVAHDLADSLEQVYGTDSVARHFFRLPPDTVEAEVERFRLNPHCQFLVCDSSVETGRNLQWADRLVHVDLPWSPNRIEQRLGRIDRFGAGEPVPSFVFVDDSPGSFSDAWVDCLSSGFDVFSQSIASLQQPIETVMGELGRGVLADGVSSIVTSSEALPERLRTELMEIESLESLESISEEGEFTQNLFEHIGRSEYRWEARQSAAEDWISQRPGNLRFHREVDGAGLRRYLAYPPEHKPRAENLPLVPWDVLIPVFEPLLGRPSSFDRSVAIARPGTRVLGVGDPFIDALTEFSQWDTRGQAFGMWRTRESWIDEPEFVAFRLDYIARVDLSRAMNLLDSLGDDRRERAMERMSDPFLPPMTHTVWLDIDGVEVTDSSLLATLTEPYDPGQGDSHLSPRRRWALDSLLPLGWAAICERAREAGVVVAGGALDLQEKAQEGAARARASFEAALQRRRLRREVGEDTSQELDWFDIQIVDALVDGIRDPRLDLDAVGCVVVAGSVPEGWYETS